MQCPTRKKIEEEIYKDPEESRKRLKYTSTQFMEQTVYSL